MFWKKHWVQRRSFPIVCFWHPFICCKSKTTVFVPFIYVGVGLDGMTCHCCEIKIMPTSLKSINTNVTSLFWKCKECPISGLKCKKAKVKLLMREILTVCKIQKLKMLQYLRTLLLSIPGKSMYCLYSLMYIYLSSYSSAIFFLLRRVRGWRNSFSKILDSVRSYIYIMYWHLLGID